MNKSQIRDEVCIRIMQCSFCENKSKYKCPKCLSHYCSITCFKSSEHKLLDEQQSVESSEPKTEQPNIPQIIPKDAVSPEDLKFQKVLENETIRRYLAEPALKHHLNEIIKLMNQLLANDQDLVSIKINELRKGGSQENILVEEFVQTFLDIYEQV